MLSKFLVALAAVFVSIAALAASASAGSWIPGTNYLVSEEDMTNTLQQKFDYAYCTGVPRFGHRGAFPDEEFVVFDCSIKRTDLKIDCFDVRVKSVKGSNPGYFRPRLVSTGGASCF